MIQDETEEEGDWSRKMRCTGRVVVTWKQEEREKKKREESEMKFLLLCIIPDLDNSFRETSLILFLLSFLSSLL